MHWFRRFLEVCNKMFSVFSPWKLGQMRLAITVLDSAHQEDCCKLWEFTRTGASCRHSHSVMAVIVEEASYCFFWILNFQMIDLTDIFTLCCFHNVKNNSLYECLWKYQSSKSFWGYICSKGSLQKKKTAYFMTSGKLGFWPTYPPWIWTK